MDDQNISPKHKQTNKIPFPPNKVPPTPTQKQEQKKQKNKKANTFEDKDRAAGGSYKAKRWKKGESKLAGKLASLE